MARARDFEDLNNSVLNGLRNQKAESFEEPEEPVIPTYYSEDPTSFIAEPAPWESIEIVGLTQKIEIESSLLDKLKKSEVYSLGDKDLPVNKFKQEITKSVTNNQFTIVVAETGGGKSTEIPQYLFEAGFTVVQTQPRRAAARNVFLRILSRISEVYGEDEAAKIVSYQTAGEFEGDREAPINIVTDGLLVARMVYGQKIKQNQVTMTDEAHEWNTNIEFEIAIAIRESIRNPASRFVISSATIEADKLANYIAIHTGVMPNVIRIPGRLHNIEKRERANSTALKETLKAAEEILRTVKPGDPNGILVFEPGLGEIQKLKEDLAKRLPPDVRKVATILPLHANMSPAEQQLCFEKYPGVKIIISTDVSQTSLTIPDIIRVIDTGFQRRKELDNEGKEGLEKHPISQADCDQRAGRCGRVTDGIYTLTRIDEKTPFTPYISRPKFPTPEILRTDIVRTVLKAAASDFEIGILKDTFHKINPEMIEKAIESLITLGAIDENGAITNIGKKMNEFPVCVSSARMMVEVGRFSDNTRAYMAAIVASKEAGGLQLFTYGAGSNWKELITETSSDMLAQLELFIATQDMSEKEMLEYDLNINSIKKAREQYKKIAKRVGISADALSKNLMPATEIEKLDLKECIYAGLVNSMFKHNGSGIYSHIGGSVKTREISNRSVVRIPSKIIFGDFFRVEYKKGGQDRKKDIIEHVTTGTLSDIGRVALHLSNWELGDFRIKNGQITQESRQFISGIDLGIVNEIPAEPSPQLRQWIKEIVIENPGPAQKKLRKIKKTLEKLAHLAKDPVPQLTQDNLLELIEKSIPEDITDHTVVDNNLRLLMESEGIELEKFVEKERQDRIISNAPEEITTEGFAFKVSYKSSVPYIRVDKFNSQQLAKLESDIFLDDHRQVKFLFEHKYHALHELQEKLAPTV